MIKAELKFFGVFRQVLLGDMHVSPIDRPFEVLPEVLKAVYVALAANVFLGAVLNHLVRITQFAKSAIRPMLIRVAGGTLLYVFGDIGDKCASLTIRNYFRHNFTAALQHSHNLCFTSRTKAAFAGMVSTNVSFVDFNIALKREFPVNVRHVFADEPGHAPSGLVGDTKLPFKFLRWNPVSRSSEKINGIEPQLQWSPRILKRRPGGRVDMVPAPLAGEGPLRFKPIPAGSLGAFRTRVSLAVSRLKNVSEALFIRGKRLHELANGYARSFFINILPFHGQEYSKTTTLCKGDNSVSEFLRLLIAREHHRRKNLPKPEAKDYQTAFRNGRPKAVNT